ncbi:MAG: methylmalonyl Co-A mutase-associated GTPase MeaB [Candidatus Eremiobacter antarcticus]|nr:methylmalonyl Co-A mutase-associated GTPase MeaB [Candidatus Eremiobacteraeota bacterium]MBC5807848.1 methylmalonyl Co-A mutase-associated GTPase MeaB [Candidatus Eremiobacteraeota bacterium]PZR62921.1 MAG: methylmalonyl Co-A mutase-associated GTPase MeaB [Candidatus Eremiobacter sp. RRmetagenome_bin22]
MAAAGTPDDDHKGARELAERVINGDWRALARAITKMENDSADAPTLAALLYPKTGHGHIIGVTGPPGSGKSTLVDGLTSVIRADGRSVGIIAVDPSSPFTGGAVLGDRVRMQRHAGDSGVFIRSMAARHNAGGLAPATRDVIRALDAFGRDVILVETVGVGQVELDIMKVADTVLVVTVPGLGDGVQTIKAGLLEIADCFVVNQSDRPGAAQTVADLRTMLTLGGAEERRRRWMPPIIQTVATSGKGLEELWAACQRHRLVLESDERMGRTRDRLRQEVLDAVARGIAADVNSRLAEDGEVETMINSVVRREIDPRTAAHKIVANHFRRERIRLPPVP